MTTYIALSILTPEPRPSVLTPLPNPTLLGGFAMLIARRDDHGWQFKLNSNVALADDDNAQLLEQLADVLPPTDHAIGWHIDSCIIDPLMIIAAKVPPVVRHHALSRMARAFGTGSIDLALAHGGLRALSFADVAAKFPCVEAVATREQIEAWWHKGERGAVTNALSQEVIGLWRMFLSVAPRSIGHDVIHATDCWVAAGAK